jgi:hypothetical protein
MSRAATGVGQRALPSWSLVCLTSPAILFLEGVRAGTTCLKSPAILLLEGVRVEITSLCS